MSYRKTIEEYCARENIARFMERLASSTDEQEIKTLRELLDEEQRRLAQLMADDNPAIDGQASDALVRVADRTIK
jgi:succinate dehydrogenase flavin-adding protein (antitoxin of CptAB toxin-antitoxin module)